MILTPSIDSNGDMTVRSGDTLAFTLTYQTDAGAAVNLTGYSAKMQANLTSYASGTRISSNGSTILFTASSADGKLTLGGAAGTIAINVSAAEMALSAGVGTYGLELTSSGGVVTTILAGKLTILPEVVS